MSLKKIIALVVAGVFTFSVLAGCGSDTKSPEATNSSQAASSTVAEVSATPKEEIAEDIEVWNTNNGYLAIEKGSAMYNYYKEKFGVGIIQPYVEWNGGTTYQEQLNLKIAAGEMPDMFLPVNGMETDLARNGAILDLTNLLPEKAPNLWNCVPEEVWNVIKSYDPNGKGGIYTIPSVLDYGRTGGLIRKDWLDKLGLSMPKTQDEFVEVLKAFRDKDPNGNKQKDEIPTGGREQARWMDYLYAMYGIAMNEGYPDWDVYKGELTYSAVTQNMKDALVFIRKLYAEGLLDQETFLNSKDKWEGKISSNRVGVYFHWVTGAADYVETIKSSFGFEADISVLPAIAAPGYEPYYTMKRINNQVWVVKNQKDQSKINACLKVLNGYGDKTQWNDLYLGLQGMHWDMKDGNPVKLPDDRSKMQNIVLQPFNDFDTLDFSLKLYNDLNTDPAHKWSMDQGIRNLQENQKYVKAIAGDGIPASIYADYPDIKNRTLYVEYATKIIIGVYPIEKFDEFVEKWYASGGQQVTDAARAWYKKTQ